MPRPSSALALLAAALVVLPAGGEEASAHPQGYLFGQPRLLTQQLVWGLAHGVELLAAACGNDQAAAKSYAEWQERHRRRIEAAARDLAQHYFGRDAASERALTAALHLKPALDRRPDEIAAACATFTEAIGGERYDLDLFYRLRRDAARVARADAVRARVAACRKRLPAEPAALLASTFSTWTQANEALEAAARRRLADHARDRLWQTDAGAGAQPPTLACDRLAAALAEPGYALADVFGDGGQ